MLTELLVINVLEENMCRVNSDADFRVVIDDDI